MMFAEIAQLISNVGFPIVMTLYLLLRLEKIIIKNTDATTQLQTAIMLLKK